MRRNIRPCVLFFIASCILIGFMTIIHHAWYCTNYKTVTEEVVEDGKDVKVKAKYEGVIPRRLHYTYKDEMIPIQYREFVQTWLTNQPDWEIYFWTDEDAISMIQQRYPEYAELIRSYDHGLMRSDAIRYMVLHQYGGVYADMDMRSLRPLESLLQSGTCILTREPEVQTRLLFNLPWSLTNCIMACAANHPFLSHVLKGLEKAKIPYKSNPDVLHATGPFFLNNSLAEYNRQYTDCRDGLSYCHVNVADGKYLVPSPDIERLREGRRVCMSPSLTASYTDLQRDACRRLLTMNTEKMGPPPEAYTEHLWTHVGWFPNKKLTFININDLVPNVFRYKKVELINSSKISKISKL